MAESNDEERDRQSKLNQERQEVSLNAGAESAHGPAPVMNAAELLLILGAAATIDFLAILSLTGFLAIAVLLIQIPATLSLWFWRVLKHQAGPKKDPTFQILAVFLGKFFSGGFLPTNTIFVLYSYFQDSKLGQKTIGTAKKVTVKA